MKWNVAARICAGFALMVLLLVGLLITGYGAISRINSGLMILSGKTTPLVIASGEVQASLLRARGDVTHHYLSEKADQLAVMEADYTKHQKQNAESLESAKNLAQDYPQLNQSLDAVAQISNEIFSIAPTILAAHRKDLEYQLLVDKKRALFSDMADEMESNVSDLMDSTGGQGRVDAEKLLNEIARANKLALGSLDKIQRAAVLGARKSVLASVAKSDALVKKMMASNLAGNRYLLAVNSAFLRYRAQVEGDQSFVALYAEQLQFRSEAKAQLAALDEKMALAGKQLVDVVQGVQLITQENTLAANATVDTSKTLLLVFFFVALMSAGIIAYIIIRGITQPLRRVVEFISCLADGDLSGDLHLLRQDELGDLARDTNTLATKLRSALGEIRSSADALAESASSSSAMAIEGNKTCQRQQAHTVQFAASMTEMVSTVREVASSASRTLEQVQVASEQTSHGHQVVNDNISAIGSLAAEIERAAEVIGKLNDRSNSISEVLEVIRNIANQTNLLALNAAIEAARAGEQGRGFAVVADEVRTLASRTQDSTQEIQGMIERLQLEAREAVTVMDQSRKEADTSVEKSRAAGTALESINGSMQTISIMNAQIASAAEEQSVVSDEMQKNIRDISDMSDSTSLASKENLRMSADVAQLADSMRTLVGQFKIH